MDLLRMTHGGALRGRRSPGDASHGCPVTWSPWARAPSSSASASSGGGGASPISGSWRHHPGPRESARL